MDEGALERHTHERWGRVIDINLEGIFATAPAAARRMRPRGFAGRSGGARGGGARGAASIPATWASG